MVIRRAEEASALGLGIELLFGQPVTRSLVSSPVFAGAIALALDADHVGVVATELEERSGADGFGEDGGPVAEERLEVRMTLTPRSDGLP
jgi:hypothetical protein